ncbi:MAG: hypothetical protein PHI31_09290 [Desulfuromonadaceae bacterium]|nr:hypothetical protein [Desulfuromonadaceae bacterium]
MLNLLFISDSQKAEYIKSVLQPALKVIIDVVSDFDHGMRDVFDKRPAIVFIQYQIGTVTGESVARHIQMLLGSTAPTFILLYNQNDKPVAIKGLYEHLIDVSLPNAALSKKVVQTLKLLLGGQWGKICVQPAAVPPPVQTSSESSASDQLPPVVSKTGKIPIDASGALSIDAALNAENSTVVLAAEDAPPVLHDHSPVTVPREKPAAIRSEKDKPEVPSVAVAPPQSQLSPHPAEFRISRDSAAVQDEDTMPEDLLLAFEENYRLESNSVKRYIALILAGVFLAGGCWYLLTKNSPVGLSLKQRVVSLTGAKTSSVAVPTPVATAKPVVPPIPKPPAKPLLPSFIPKEGLDSSYAAGKPGWERYVGADVEFRVFSDSGRLKALQVLAIKDGKIPEQLLKSVLQEFAGSSEYKVTSKATKSGVRVENGTIDNKGEIEVYRKSGSVRAFVVSLN